MVVESAEAPLPDRKIVSIEQLRGVAALAVVVCHIGGHFYGFDRFSPGPAKLFGWLGEWGVALFFVISGFCIRLPMARAKMRDAGARLDAGEFIAHRFLRIAPPYWLALVLSVAAGLLMRTELIDGSHRPLDVLVHALALHTLTPWTFNSINGVFWTIGLEVHFYAAYLLFANRRMGWRTWAGLFVVGLAIFAAASALLVGNPWRIVGQEVFVTSFWQWCLGAVLADWFVRAQPVAPAGRLWAGRWGMVALSLLIGLVDPRIAGLHLMPVVLPFAAAGIVGLFVVRPASGPAPGGLLSEVLAFLGRISYSLYLFHPIALSLVAFALGRSVLPGGAGPVTELLLSVVLAWGSYRLVERPLLAWRARMKSTVGGRRNANLKSATAA